MARRHTHREGDSVAWIFFAVSLWGAFFTINTFYPLRRPGIAALVSFFAGWLTTELALHHILWQLIATCVFIALGALDHWPGQLGLVITLLSWAGLLFNMKRAQRAEHHVDSALHKGLGVDYLDHLPEALRVGIDEGFHWGWFAWPFRARHKNVETLHNVVYHEVDGVRLKLDIHRHLEHRPGAPILMYVHGGGWVVGYRKYQGQPLLRHMAAKGWLCISVGYRLSPKATWPDHVVDVKRALAWIKANAHAHGGDPRCIVISGNSAGGHLASLTALTQNEPEFQPGFESIDTSLSACVSFYGVYDLTNRFGHWKATDLRVALERLVMKRRFDEDPEPFHHASPYHWVGKNSPPFMMLHGSSDALVPVEEARRFHDHFVLEAEAPVVYAELPGAQHAYEVFPSLRTAHTLKGVERFLAWFLARHLDDTADDDDDSVRRWLDG